MIKISQNEEENGIDLLGGHSFSDTRIQGVPESLKRQNQGPNLARCMRMELEGDDTRTKDAYVGVKIHHLKL